MSDFIEIIPIAGKKYYFTFTEMSTPDNKKFLVTTLENGDAVSFEIGNDRFEKWTIIEPVPKWIKQIEGRLLEAINNRNEK
jgi:hypothetical protein